MAEFVRSLLGWVLRLGLLLAGLVFFASVLAAGLLLLMVWMLRALWAKLTGRPVSPWTFQMNRQAAWQHFYQRASRQQRSEPNPNSGPVVDAEANDATDVTDVTVVTDVEPKRITPR